MDFQKLTLKSQEAIAAAHTLERLQQPIAGHDIERE